ncbi:hypothetical protein PCG10_002161 [Penicillium crustosum]|uniref:Uncharacterized protein n=1 Tax=Penicillium crustosum TaxID=36656 RepID=A0A9P5KWG0_PENCR|nr:uncharacterized protein N7487_010409 [Penicillium crustosum]KAF7516400.1 hypothetical protein PCG10_002161 [Penicillium crustosum]KAJ5396106.1 hypothetical protein N7487_010409 [Penicillium crustosum]
MSRQPQSIASAGSESVRSIPQRSSPREERSGSNPASYMGDNDDTALPSMEFHSQCHSQPSIAHRRTGSTLKTVMRKIFNRKRQSQADELEENPYESTFAMPPMRKSGPAKGKALLAVPPPLNLNSHRGSPLSAENLQLAETHLSPLLSPLSPLSSATLRDSMPGSMQPRRRRATLPSVVFSDDESRFAVASIAVSDPQEDRSHIPERRHSLLSHRLSRSTDALREMTDNVPEIMTAWPQRTSSAPRPASVPDSQSPPLDESSNSGHSGRPSSGTTVTSVTRMSAEPSLMEVDPAPQQPSLPSNLASLVNTMQQDDSVTLEQRLTTLEVKLIDLEFAIARMQTNGPENPTEKPSRPRHPPSADSFPPHMRNKPTAFLSSIDRDDSPSPLPNVSTRPSSTNTIRADTMAPRTLRPAPSASSLSDYQGVSIEQYSTLVTLLRREQTARRNLETQVGSLRDDIRDLQRAALGSMQSGISVGMVQPAHSTQSQQFLRFRRALDDSDNSSALRSDDKRTGIDDTDSDWDRSDIYSRDDPFGPPKWERQRVVTAPMI